MKAEKLDTLTLRADEEDALNREYCKWGYKLAGILGFGVIAGTAATIAKVLFVIFLVLFIASFFRGSRTG